jgi:hypothetical protein
MLFVSWSKPPLLCLSFIYPLLSRGPVKCACDQFCIPRSQSLLFVQMYKYGAAQESRCWHPALWAVRPLPAIQAARPLFRGFYSYEEISSNAARHRLPQTASSDSSFLYCHVNIATHFHVTFYLVFLSVWGALRVRTNLRISNIRKFNWQRVESNPGFTICTCNESNTNPGWFDS